MIRPRPPRNFETIRASEPEPNGAVDELAQAMFRLSLNPDGQALLAWLRKTSADAVVSPEQSDSALRMMEGRRQVHAEIWNLIRRGELESRNPQSES